MMTRKSVKREVCLSIPVLHSETHTVEISIHSEVQSEKEKFQKYIKRYTTVTSITIIYTICGRKGK